MRKLVSLTIALMALAFPVSASADDRDCNGTIGPEVVQGNVRVAEGASCVLAGTVVTGNVQVGQFARLTATDVTVHGSMQATGVNRFSVEGDSFIRGSVQVKGHDGILVDDARIVGSAEFSETSGSLDVTDNSIDGNLSVLKNRGAGGTVVTGNSVGGNLSCSENEPPFVAFGNVVRGNTEGQCQ